ncbi:endonuclease III domain-containing protein [Dehalococcoides mccartyi]|uniref:DNA repair protein, HhH-GPD family n=1 Tax=Dehalococcoides mccartyi TaxID=61435 RepID=A0A142VC33_9CHLR|nr:endonuclease III domain-containing protein [Dehalococcoides mccartyi]AII61597.1 HhH-GPD family protein [Dehalococcoides mccartyi CG5]AMU87400.1 DNA repair protein, HhH-GPD family [Dehalococcoides mccartyi]AOW00043.1 endonuclease III [Dehalococcoides mccartyi]MBA2084407.1 Endonuclease III [Dehalococcoides mccartyi]QBX64595.1 endonuclease III domain-containing protein [Dehalococcoides mccartyi]
MDKENLAQNLADIYQRLLKKYGPQHWWPAESRFEMMAGAVLTQSAAWTNVEKAISRLKEANLLSAEAILQAADSALAESIRPSGYFNVKVRKLKALSNWLQTGCGGQAEKLLEIESSVLRDELLSVWGIGEETADSILLYACGKPVFVIDAYTRRIFSRLGLTEKEAGYDRLQRLFTANLAADAALYNEYHALIVRHAKEHCRVKPGCEGCVLKDVCRFDYRE